MTASRAGQRAVIALLGLILGGGLWLRLAHLERPSFDTDEYYHVFAGQELNAGHGPRLPSGNLYTRALPFTKLVAVSFAHLGVSETSARLPGVVFGMLVILATFFIGRRWFGAREGLLAAALVAVSPLMVDTARLCRMYSLFQLLYLGAVFSYEQGWEQPAIPVRRRAAWTGVAIALAGASLLIHSLTAVIVPATIAYWAGRALVRWRSRYTLFLMIVMAMAAAGVLTGIVDLRDVSQRAHFVPGWAEARRAEQGFYIREWLTAAPWLLWAAPLASLWLLAKHRARGFFLLCQFAVPFALHSFVFDWKVSRYVSHLFPLLALIVAPLLVRCGAALARWGRDLARPLPRALQWATDAVAPVLLALAMAVGTRPSLTQAMIAQDDPKTPRWREAYKFLAGRARPGDAIIVGLPLATLYYLGRPATHELNNAERDFSKQYHDSDGLWRDWYSGVPMVTSLEEFRMVQVSYPRGWLLTNWGRFYSSAHTPDDLRRYLAEHCRAYHPIEGSKSILVFGWGEQ